LASRRGFERNVEEVESLYAEAAERSHRRRRSA
jgi:hypothetical protein